MNGYWKFHRKMLENELFRDEKAFRLFIWILSSVNYKTGKMTTGRYRASEQLKMNPNTFYKALQRLKRDYKVTILKSNNKMTEITVINWAKYQHDDEEVTSKEHQSNNKVTHTKELRSKEIKNNLLANKSQAIAHEEKEVKPYTRKPLNEASQLQRVCYFLEDTLQTRVTNWGKQATGLKMLLQAGYTEEQIRKCIVYMATKDDFFRDKGFDLMTVANIIPKYKAEARKAVKHD